MESIRIRVTGWTVTELVLNVEKIKEGLSQWGVKPTECLWDRSGDFNINVNTDGEIPTKPIIDDNDIIREQKRLNNAIEDLKDQMNSINRTSIKKTISEERKARQEILR